MQLNFKIIIPKHEERFAIQILSQCLAHRVKDTELEIPTMALRSSLDNYETYKMFDRIDLLGASEVVPLFENPLPGTNGRGLNILFTSYPVKGYYRGLDIKSFKSETKSNEEMLKDILKVFKKCRYHQKKKEVTNEVV